MAKKARKRKGVKYWKKKAWAECSKYIRLRDALRSTKTKEALLCCTCGQPYPAFGKGCAQAGHFIIGRGNSVLFDERGIHGQCYNCNINLKGNWPQYMKFMMAEYGQEVVDELIHKHKQVIRYTPVELEEIRDRYKGKYNLLNRKEKQ